MANGREMSRAERFEDEKRRIIESCFSKRDEEGSVLETYITHLRIVEYATNPTSPPPPHARTPQSQKPRVIVVAVRKSGRVRMHKTKENPNGTFSIGKTWNLDDLSQIESFSSPSTPANYREWAGDVGFTVVLGKPYYWQAQTDKEKRFFIASLIKIYSKYTAGRTPNLVGFDSRELEQVMAGSAQASRRQESVATTTATVTARQPTPLGRTRLPPIEAPAGGAAPQGAAYNSTAPWPPQPTTVERAPSRGPSMANGGLSPAQSFDSRTLRRLASQGPDSDAGSSFTARSDDGSLRPRSRNGVNGSAPTSEPRPFVAEKVPPERKRPPMETVRPQTAENDLVPAPLVSASVRRDAVIPSRNSNRISSRREDGSALSETSSGERRVEAEPIAPTDRDTAQERPLQEEEEEEEEEDSRPGLGPMIKARRSKGEIAGAFKRAAAAASAFQPRRGGAGERLRLKATTSAEGPDGIHSVVPAPPPLSAPVEPVQTLAPPPKAADRAFSVPDVKVTSHARSRANSLQTSLVSTQKSAEAVAKEEAPKSLAPTGGNDVRYLSALGVDPSMLNKATFEFAKWLDHFGWMPGEQMRTRNYDDMKMDMERELNQAQAGGWLARLHEEDQRVESISVGLDVAMDECEEMDNLLTLYSVELSTLSDDIAYIEAQGQGLQVQAANQKLLMKELESLLETCAISMSDLNPLKASPLEDARGVEEIEAALVTLYQAMVKIDPTIGHAEALHGDEVAVSLNSDYGSMRIVQEKRQMYTAESAMFMGRLVDFMTRQFVEARRVTRAAMDQALSRKAGSRHHDAGRQILYMYSPLMLYAFEVHRDHWSRMLKVYDDTFHPVYRDEFRETLALWKKNARKATGDEADLLFTSLQEKKEEGLATTARKLTVKRSQTLAKTLRSPLGDRGHEKASDTRALPYVVFGSVLDDLLPLVEVEQNWIVDFFHASTLVHVNFPEAVAAVRPAARRGNDLSRYGLMEPDRDLGRVVFRAMETIFGFLEHELQQLIEFALSMDPLQGVGVLVCLEAKMADTPSAYQEFLFITLQKLHSSLEGRFRKFVDDQVRAIEETKVKIKKRKGVIGFMRIFPHFLATVETMLASADAGSNMRRSVNREYERIHNSMWESLKVIARENPAMAVAGSGGNTTMADPEDKETLNHHVLMIENMNHYLEATAATTQAATAGGGAGVLSDWRDKARVELDEHMHQYINAVMRRPLGKLLDYLENIDAQVQGGKTHGQVAAQPSNSRATFHKVLAAYDGREVRKGVETLRRRVEKHFSAEESGGDDDAAHAKDSNNNNKSLVNRVLRECERFYTDIEMRIARAVTEVYGGDVAFEWPRADVKSAFAGVGR